MRIKSLCLVALSLVGMSCMTYAQECPSIQVCFSPEQSCSKTIVQAIADAKESILVQAYSFTSSHIAKALVSANKRGVKVAVIIDNSWFANNMNLSRAMHYLYKNHIPIWLDYKAAIAHNKIIIIDRETLLTGSYNFTVSADVRNAENLLLIHSPTLAKSYMANWYKRQGLAQKLPDYDVTNAQALKRFMAKNKAEHAVKQAHRDQAIRHSIKSPQG